MAELERYRDVFTACFGKLSPFTPARSKTVGNKEPMKVKDIATAAGVKPDTVRFYTREGLLNPTRNPDNNYQQYDAEDLRRLRFARKARQLGFSLPEIRQILEQADDHHSPCPMVRDVFQKRLAAVENEIAQLQQLRQRMVSALAAWQDMPDATPDGHTICRLIEHWDDPTEGCCHKEPNDE